LTRFFHNVFGVELKVVLAFLLGKIHGFVGRFHQGLFVCGILRINTDADACRYAAFFIHKKHWLESGGKDLLGYCNDLT